MVGIFACLALASHALATLLGIPLLETGTAPLGEVLDASEPPALDDAVARRWEAEPEIRNVFCPSCGPEPAVDPPESSLPADDAGLPLSAAPLRLVATMDLGDRASLATIYDVREQVVGIYAIGDPLLTEAELVSIGSGYVVLRNAGRLERLVFGQEAIPTARPPTTTSHPTEPRAEKDPSGYDGRVECSDEHTCQVDRALVEELFGNPMALAKELRGRPKMVDGRLEGFQLAGIRRGSLPSRLGLNNGDVVVELNGQALGSTDELLSMAVKLRRASRVSATVVRKGRRVTKTLEVR